MHLTNPQFAGDLEAVLERARAAGVRRFLCAGYDLESSRAAVELAARHPGVLAAVGVHPHDASTYDAAVETALEVLLRGTPRPVAVGETGLDYHYERSPRQIQQEVLTRHLALARRHSLPVILHNRESDADMARILAAAGEGLRGVLHAFTGTPLLLDLGRRLRLFFGIGGFLAFKNHPLSDVVRALPADLLLLETDAPYLAPPPLRGRRNEPANVRLVAERLAEILQTSLGEVAARTSANFDRFLGPTALRQSTGGPCVPPPGGREVDPPGGGC